jgi:uncharacterized protein (TIGR01619 family)
MSDQWDFYLSRVNDALASLMVDLGIHREVPQSDRPWLLWVFLYMRTPREDGLSDAAEADSLADIEDSLVSTMRDKVGACLVGRITTSGRREFYFYSPSPEAFGTFLKSTMQQFPLYDYDFGSKEDSHWTQYLSVLYPSPRDYQRIKNRHVIETLTQSGDTLEQPRDIDHWIYFRTGANRRAFIERVKQRGFRVKDESLLRDQTDRAYCLSISRRDRADWDSVNAVVLDLFELANEMDGDYDGWETCLIKSQS